MRKSGNTFRVCLSALLKASEGKNVLVIVRDSGYAKALTNTLLEICNSYLDSGFFNRNGIDIIKFKNGAHVKVISEENYIQKERTYDIRYLDLIFDGSVLWKD